MPPRRRPAPGSARASLEDQIVTATVNLAHTAVARQAARLAAAGISDSEARALRLLELHGPLTSGALTRHLGLSPASVTGLVNRLERKGLAKRQPHPDDGRSILIDTTPAWRKRHGISTTTRQTRVMLSAYSDTDLTAIHQYLTAAINIID